MLELFSVVVPAITKWLGYVSDSEELTREVTISKMETVRQDGNREGTR